MICASDARPPLEDAQRRVAIAVESIEVLLPAACKVLVRICSRV